MGWLYSIINVMFYRTTLFHFLFQSIWPWLWDFLYVVYLHHRDYGKISILKEKNLYYIYYFHIRPSAPAIFVYCSILALVKKRVLIYTVVYYIAIVNRFRRFDKRKCCVRSVIHASPMAPWYIFCYWRHLLQNPMYKI